jgi:hypothetical protein
MITVGSSTTRDERLAWDPDEAVELARRPEPDESSTVATAMYDQLSAAGVPVEAVEMCIVFFSRALDGLDPGPVPADRLARLDSDLELEHRTTPRLSPWLTALRRRIASAHDLDWTIRFLMQVQQTWRMSLAFRRKGG